MAYAGICLTDDLQAHSDPYFSERSLQEISTYTSSNQAAINEVQTASLRHFGGGNEVQVVTFGPGYAPTATIQPLSLAIGAAPSATRAAARRRSATPSRSRPAQPAHAAGRRHGHDRGRRERRLQRHVDGDSGAEHALVHVHEPDRPASPISGGGTVTLAAPGASESGNTVTFRTALAHGRSVGDVVTISGVGVAGYNGTYTITAVPTPRSVRGARTRPPAWRTRAAARSTYFSPFQVRIGGERLGRDRRHGAAVHQREHHRRRSTRSRASRARRRSPAPRRPASPSPTAAHRPASTCRASRSRTSAAAAASPRSRRRTTAARTTRSRSTTTARLGADHERRRTTRPRASSRR